MYSYKEQRKILKASMRRKKRETRPVVSTFSGDRSSGKNEKVSKIRVMTLNAAHGRKNGAHQIFQRKSSIISNLDDIAGVFGRERPHIVALQEADGPSMWSGNFCHVEYLAQKSRYAFAVRGEHVKGIRLSYGTALLSDLDVSNPVSVRFPISPPLPSKGFIACKVGWPGESQIQIDVVSVHLDFARKSVRQKQVEELVSILSRSTDPKIMMGDFNCEWKSKDPSLRMLAEQLNLDPYDPDADDMSTYPKRNKRLDWILISPELEFSTYRVFDDAISDHLGVITEIGLAGSRSVAEPEKTVIA